MIKFLKRSLSTILVFALLINLLPLHALALDAPNSISSMPSSAEIISDAPIAIDTSITDEQEVPVEVVGEDISKRSEFYKEFVLSNGLRLATIYPDAVHYEEDGQWKEIDNTLTEKVVNGQSVYTNTAGMWDVRFPRQLGASNAISITKDGYTVSFAMAGEMRSSGDLVVASTDLDVEINSTNALSVGTAQISPAQLQEIDTTLIRASAEFEETVPDKLYSKLMYPAIYNNTNVVYDLKSNQLKESVIIQSYDKALQGYRYELNTGGLIPVVNNDQSIDLCDPATDVVVMTMPAPFMLDANDEYCDEVSVSLVPKMGTYLLSYYLPLEWLSAEDRAWPVILDPIVSANNDRTNIQDITVAENDIESNNATTIKCGYHLTKGILRAYLRYKVLPALSSSDVIVSAKISLIKPYDSTLAAPIQVHKVNTAWEASDTSWSNNPGFNSTIEDITVVQSPATYTWDITEIARGWYADTSNALLNNTGMMFKATDEIETAGEKNWQQFCSSDFGSDRPILEIKYYTANGLETYWDYTSSSAGRAGTGNIQNYSGNLVWVHNDIGFDGNRMPVSISHVYNAHDAWNEENGTGNNPFGMGNGWRTNYNQKIYVDPTTGHYIWEDGDGTQHEFNATSGTTHKDTDDLGLILTVSSSGYTLTDKYDNKSVFDLKGRLTQQVNNQATSSSITILYRSETSNLISQIQDGVGRKYVFNYNSNGLLKNISYYSTYGITPTYLIMIIEFVYTNANLTSITYNDRAVTSFGYTSKNLLSSATDVDGYKIAYSYNTLDPNKPSRVASITESDNGINGGHTTLTYGYNSTILKDHDNNSQTSFFNVWGNTTSVQDSEGNATFYQYATDVSEYATRHRLLQASQPQNTVVNLIKDHSFENGSTWTIMSSGDTCTNSSAGAFLGSKGLKITTNTFTGTNGVKSGSYTVSPGASYTFSAHFQCSGNMHLSIVDDLGVTAEQQFSYETTWTRGAVTYTNNSTENRTIRLYVKHFSTGTTYLDCVQLEKSEGASRYNLAQNSDFSYSSSGTPYGWVLYPYDEYEPSLSATGNPPSLSPNCIRIDGGKEGVQCVYQTITVSGATGDQFVFSGWAWGDALPELHANNTREFRLYFMFTYNDGTNGFVYADFNPHLGTDQWQYLAASATAEKAYQSVTIRAEHSYNANTVYFDGLQVFKEVFGETYDYYDNGNVKQIVDVLGQSTTYEYTNNNLTATLLPTNIRIENTYDTCHNVTQSEKQYKVYIDEHGSFEWVTFETETYEYDSYGNVKKTTSTAETTEGTVTKTTSATYSSNGNFLASSTDASGNTTKYGYDIDESTLRWIQYPEDVKDNNNIKTYYDYDDMFRLKKTYTTTDQSNNMSAEYTYTNDALTKIETPSTVYSIAYGDFALRTSITAGGKTLATYKYTNDENNNLEELDYGNFDKVKYTYDNLGRVVKEVYTENGTSTVTRTITYAYDNTGALATMVDSKTGITTKYYYDTVGRITAQIETSNSLAHSLRYTYDEHGRVSKMREYSDGSISSASYTYDPLTQYLTKSAQGIVVEDYTYDNFGRIKSKSAKYGSIETLKETITYKSNSDQVTQIALSGPHFNRTYTYNYDKNGNILSVNDGSYTTSYVYDSQNQLIRENNQEAGNTWVWTYDDAGNITSKKEYAYTTGTLGTATDTITYSYGNSTWGDLLTSYDGKTISYDTIGNPLSDGTWTYAWRQGRQLSSMTSGSNQWNFTYDANGMRTERSNKGIIYSYLYNGSQLSRMIYDGIVMKFTYAADGSPISVTYQGGLYYYAVNLQGDVVAIVDKNGALVVEYKYDAWGRLLTTTGSMAPTLGLHNPLRYRGYVYDRETGLYYLQSRYYNPTIGRFINADGLVATGQGLTGNNMFAYCRNNPVMYADPTGEIAISTVVWIIVGVAALATVGTITYGAVTDTPVVVDISGSAGTGAGVGVKVGLSVVIDFKNDSFGFYPHYGYYYGMKYNTFGGSYSVGLIQNYENEGDYAGPFTSMGGGYLGGVDHCYDPRYSHDDTVKADSLTFGNNKGVYYGYDYYGYWGSVPFPWRDQ